jgi:hypothetical protein
MPPPSPATTCRCDDELPPTPCNTPLIATQGRLFFSHRRRTLLLLVYVFSLTPLALSPQKDTPVPTTTLALSLSLLRRSLARSVCSDVPADISRSPPLATRALRIALNFSPQKAGAAASRPAACTTAKGAKGDVDHAVLHAIAAAVTPPLILLLSRTRLVESPRQGEN